MKKQLAIIFALSALLCGCTTPSVNPKIKEYNAFYPSKIWLDNNGRHINAHGAGFIFDGGKYYMFGEHKLGGVLGNMSVVGVHCYSSQDLYNWKDMGIALEMSDNPESEIFVGAVIERPKVLFNKKTGKYVMFFHLEPRKGKTAKDPSLSVIEKESPDYSSALLGFAVANSVEGPYKFVKAQRLHANVLPQNASEELVDLVKSGRQNKEMTFNGASIKNGTPNDIFAKHFKEGQYSRDFTAFLDDDGKAYIISASLGNSSLIVSQLDESFLNFTGKYTLNFIGQYHEAPALFKAKCKYYMFSSHCTGWAPNAGRVSVANNVMGPWYELGNPCRGKGQPETKFTPNADADTTFRSQSTAVIKVQNKPDSFIYVGDRWNPNDAIDGRYIFLPIQWENDTPVFYWQDKWDLSFFDKKN